MNQPRFAYNALVLRKPYSGVENTIHGFLDAWAQYGPEPLRLYAPWHTPLPLPQSALLVPRRIVLPVPHRLARIACEQGWLPAQLRCEGAALLHAPAYIAPLAAPCPVVLTVHDLHVFTHPHCCTLANRLYYRLFLPRSLRRAAAIVVFSEHVRRVVVVRFPAVAERIAVIPPGVAPDMIPCIAAAHLDQVRQSRNLPAHFLLYVGDLGARKNLPQLLRALARLAPQFPDTHLVLVGQAANRWPPLQRLAAQLGIAARVHHLGYVPRTDLAALYTLATALAFPSLDEGFGLPALEALACGCPVVCGPGGAAEICGASAIGCDPGDVNSITAALIKSQLAAATPRAARLAAAAPRLQHYSWPRHIRAMHELYNAVARS